jgi:hypothetical protein
MTHSGHSEEAQAITSLYFALGVLPSTYSPFHGSQVFHQQDPTPSFVLPGVFDHQPPRLLIGTKLLVEADAH